MRRPASDADPTAFEVAYLFLEKNMSVMEIARQLRIPRPTADRKLKQAVRKGYVQYLPPVIHTLQKQLIAKFHACVADDTFVVDKEHHVPLVASQIAYRFVTETWCDRGKPEDKPVAVAMGPGDASAQCASSLANQLHATPSPPLIHLLALTGGGPADAPGSSPISFFNYFDEGPKTALFAPSLVMARDYADVLKTPGIKEAVAAKQDISLVVTSMGERTTEREIRDGKPRDLLSRALQGQSKSQLKRLLQKDYVANIQYRPLDSRGEPIVEDDDMYRSVTLFELDDLRRLSQARNKAVVLMVRNKRKEALLPIIEVPQSRRFFTHIVLDKQSANAVLS